MFITPPKEHIHIDDDWIIGIFLTKHFGLGGTNGTAIIGVQGDGAPNFAATLGFAIEVHIAKGITFTNGLKSFMSIGGWFPIMVIFVGRTTIGIGATPKEHFA